MLGVRWFRSMKVQSPLAKTLGGIWLLMFVPALLALLPGHVRWMGVIPDRRPARPHRRRRAHPLPERGWRLHRLRHRARRRAVSFDRVLVLGDSSSGRRRASPSSLRCGIATKTGKQERAKKRQQKELEKRRISKPVVTTQLIPSRPATAASSSSVGTAPHGH